MLAFVSFLFSHNSYFIAFSRSPQKLRQVHNDLAAVHFYKHKDSSSDLLLFGLYFSQKDKFIKENLEST